MRNTSNTELTLEDLNVRLGKAIGRSLVVSVVGSVTMAQCYENFKWCTNEDKNGNEYYALYDENLEVPMIFVDLDSIVDIEDNGFGECDGEYSEIHIVIWMDGEVCLEIDEG